MSTNDGTTPQGFVHPQDRGVNGLPEVNDLGDDAFEAYGDVASGGEYPRLESSRTATASRSDYYTWVAVGAVAVGLVGAIVGCMRQSSRRRTSRRGPMNVPDSHGVTPPHGDKLLRRL